MKLSLKELNLFNLFLDGVAQQNRKAPPGVTHPPQAKSGPLYYRAPANESSCLIKLTHIKGVTPPSGR